MKIRFFISTPNDFVELLQQQLEEAGHTVVYEGSDVDLIHILGAPTYRAKKMLGGARTRLIPVVWSPMRTVNKWMLQHATAVHVWGLHEQEQLQKLAKNATDLLIKNPIITNDITNKGLLAGITQLYKSILEKHDTQMRADIESRIAKMGETEETLHKVLFEFLYMRYLFQRHAIPVDELRNMRNLMTASNYNEEEMSSILKKLKLHDFIASLETVMEEEASLTEGFEPVTSLDNHLTKKIRKIIIKEYSNNENPTT